MQTTAAQPAAHSGKKEQNQHVRVERRFSAQRQLKELVRDLLRAHSG